MSTKLSIFCDYFIEAGWLTLIIATPLFTNIYSARSYEPDKIILLRSITTLMAVAWLVASWERNAHHSRPNIRLWLKHPLIAPVLVLVTAYLISSIFSLTPAQSWWGSYQRLQGTYTFLSYITVFTLVATHLRQPEQVDRLVTTIIITSVAVTTHTMLENMGLNPSIFCNCVYTPAAATLGNHHFLTLYMVLVVPFTLSRLLDTCIDITQRPQGRGKSVLIAIIYIIILIFQISVIGWSYVFATNLGILTALFIMGLLGLLTLRQQTDDKSTLIFNEVITALFIVVPLFIITLIGGVLGYIVAIGIQTILQVNDDFLLGSILIGGSTGLAASYGWLIIKQQGWRWLWLSWLGLWLIGLTTGYVLLWDKPAPKFVTDTYYPASVVEDFYKTMPIYRLIWRASIDLMKPHHPVGIPDDPFAPPDPFNLIRPLIGYGPEAMFNAFFFVYPPELAQLQLRGSGIDRAYNESVDTLIITGLWGLLAYYTLMGMIFYESLKGLGWLTTSSTRQVLIYLLIGGPVTGLLITYLLDVSLIPLGMSFGLYCGLLFYLIGQGIIGLPITPLPKSYHILHLALFAVMVGYFIETQFYFTTSVTYTYFWVCLGLMVALLSHLPTSATPTQAQTSPEFTWLKAVQGQGISIAIVLIILTFNFVSNFGHEGWFKEIWNSREMSSVFKIYGVTWLAALALILGQTELNSFRHTLKIIFFFIGGSVGYTVIYGYGQEYIISFSRQQFTSINTPTEAIEAANSVILLVFFIYGALVTLMTIFALQLSWRDMRGHSTWRATHKWLYITYVAMALTFIWFKNINAMRADVYLKEGERWRSGQHWASAIALHELGRDLDSDEDFYYLMLALDYQLMAQDKRLK